MKSKREADLYQLVLPKVSLNSAVWESNKLNPDVRDALLRIANEFYIFLGVNTP